MFKSTKIYLFLFTILTCLEIIMAFPLAIDWMTSKENFMIIPFIISSSHIVVWGYHYLYFSEYVSIPFHVLGIISIFTNYLFGINFCVHLIILIIGIFFLKGVRKKIRRKERLSEQKELIEQEYDLRRENELELPSEFEDITLDNYDEFL